MKANHKAFPALFSAAGMMILILDSKTAMDAAGEGLALCIKTVIPSLLPFIVLSMVLTKSMTGTSIPLLRPLCRQCGIPDGAESLLLIGLIGGYPVGAQCIAHTWRSGQLSKKDAHRMLGFCSNAGPAFIFGMCASLFQEKWMVWLLWLVQILTVLLTGLLLPKAAQASIQLKIDDQANGNVMNQAINVMAGICGWVILFRILTAFCSKWILVNLADSIGIIAAGILELTNGCLGLSATASPSERFILCSVFLSFGGLCVGMQTRSVTAGLGTGLYFPGKLLQCVISFILAALVQQSLVMPILPVIYLGILLTGNILQKFFIIVRNNSRILSP